MKYNKQQGVTLLETILVLSLIAIIMIGGLTLYNNASNSSKANKIIREVTAMANEIKGLYASKSDYVGINDKDLISAGVVPEHMIISPTRAKGPMGGNLWIDEVDPASFYIVFDSIPSGVCHKIFASSASFGAEYVGPDDDNECFYGETGSCRSSGFGLSEITDFCGDSNTYKSNDNDLYIFLRFK